MYIHPTNSYWQTKEDEEDRLDSIVNAMYYDIMDETNTYSKRLAWLIENVPEEDVLFCLEDEALFNETVEKHVAEYIKDRSNGLT